MKDPLDFEIVLDPSFKGLERHCILTPTDCITAEIPQQPYTCIAEILWSFHKAKIVPGLVTFIRSKIIHFIHDFERRNRLPELHGHRIMDYVQPVLEVRRSALFFDLMPLTPDGDESPEGKEFLEIHKNALILGPRWTQSLK